MDIIVSNFMILVGIALFSAVILYFVSQKFIVKENPQIGEVETILPGANCGACGKAGCHNFAESCVKSSNEEFSKLFCPVGGSDAMKKIATILGYTAQEKEAVSKVTQHTAGHSKKQENNHNRNNHSTQQNQRTNYITRPGHFAVNRNVT